MQERPRDDWLNRLENSLNIEGRKKEASEPSSDFEKWIKDKAERACYFWAEYTGTPLAESHIDTLTACLKEMRNIRPDHIDEIMRPALLAILNQMHWDMHLDPLNAMETARVFGQAYFIVKQRMIQGKETDG